MASTFSFALRVLKGRLLNFLDRVCPYCQSSKTVAVGRKYLILQLRKCCACGLKYRFPKDEQSYCESYYQKDYMEPSVTDYPLPDQLSKLISTAFQGSVFDKSDKVDFVISRLGDNFEELHVLDYGASFGYLMSQFRARGIKHLLGYELSRQRGLYGVKNLGEEILSDTEEVLSHPMFPFDVIITSHVLEHLSCIGDALDFFSKVVKRPGGRLIVWVPNASKEALDRFHNGSWAPLVGEPHLLALDYDFFKKSLPKHGFKIVEAGDQSDAELRLVAVAV